MENSKNKFLSNKINKKYLKKKLRKSRNKSQKRKQHLYKKKYLKNTKNYLNYFCKTVENNYLVTSKNRYILKKYFQKYKQILFKNKKIRANKIFNNLPNCLLLKICDNLNNKNQLKCINKRYNNIIKYNCHNCCKKIDILDIYKCQINNKFVKLCRKCYKKWYNLLSICHIEFIREKNNSKELIKISVDRENSRYPHTKQYEYFRYEPKITKYNLFKFKYYNRKDIKIYVKKYFRLTDKISKEYWYDKNEKVCEKIYNKDSSIDRMTYFKNYFDVV